MTRFNGAEVIGRISKRLYPAAGAAATQSRLRLHRRGKRTKFWPLNKTLVAPTFRVCIESVTSGQRRYQILSPGSRSDISGAVQRLIRRLPAGEEWFSYRRVV